MNSIIFHHNFCESKLQNYEAPEILNAYSSFFITLIPLYMGIPKNMYFKNVSYMLICNGFFSFYYHYTLSWLGKHLDEVTMILANYFGICGLLELYDYDYQNKINTLNTIFVPIFIASNTIPQLDYLFSLFFTFYIVPTVYIIYDVAKIYNYKKTVLSYLTYSLLGAISWIVSELYCNEYSKYGHVLWHIFFPFGFYKILKIYDSFI